MFVEPTINDFLDNVRWHLAKAVDRAGRSVGPVTAQLASKGALMSGRAIIMIFAITPALMSLTAAADVTHCRG